MAEEWERLASSPGRWGDASEVPLVEGAKYIDQEETGVSHSGVSSQKPPTK